jgi:hypothetical protein
MRYSRRHIAMMTDALRWAEDQADQRTFPPGRERETLEAILEETLEEFEEVTREDIRTDLIERRNMGAFFEMNHEIGDYV